MVGMWIARQLIDDLEPEDDKQTPLDTKDGQNDEQDYDPQEQSQDGFFSNLTKMGGQLINEGGTFLSEMNETVFKGAVGELLAPTDSDTDSQGVGRTVGVLGSSEIDHDEAIAAVAQYLARKGYNMLTSGPTGISTCACESYVDTDYRRGRCIGVFPLNRQKKSQNGGLSKLVDIPIYVEGENLLATVAHSSHLLVIFPADDDFLLNAAEKIDCETPCVVYGDRERFAKYNGIFKQCTYVQTAEDVARFVAGNTTITEGGPLRRPKYENPPAQVNPTSTSPPTTKQAPSPDEPQVVASVTITSPPSTNPHATPTPKTAISTTPKPKPGQMKPKEEKKVKKIASPIPRPDSLDDLASYEVIESPARRSHLSGHRRI